MMAAHFGLQLQWQSPAASSNNHAASVDIIFVHGLTGDSRTTWTHQTSRSCSNHLFWPTDFLPKDLPFPARILTFDYPNTPGDLAHGPSIDFCAIRLFFAVRRLRAAEAKLAVKTERPIVFVAHEFGAIIVKRACSFWRAAHANGSKTVDREIVGSARGFIFFSTPNQTPGSAPASLQAPVKLISETQTRSSLVRTDMVALNPIKAVIGDFQRLLRISPYPKVITFTEDDGQQIESEEQPEPSSGDSHIPLVGDRESICKFKSRGDVNYRQVVGALKLICLQLLNRHNLRLPPRQTEVELLNTLYVKNNQANAPVAAEATCSWILDHENFKRWVREPSRVLQLQGLPGAGKTVLSQYLVGKFNQCPCLRESNRLVLYHFFSQTGDSLQRSSRGLIQSLLHQLLSSNPYSISPDLPKLYQRKRETDGLPGRDWEWREEELKDFFESHLSRISSVSDKLTIIVDALDEGYHSEFAAITNYFQDLVKPRRHQPSIRVCISSRPHRISENILQIPLQDCNRIGLTYFIGRQLAELTAQWHVCSYDRYRQVTDVIVNMASGVFLRAKLALSQMEHSWEHGHQDVTLINFPPQHSKMYEFIVGQIRASSTSDQWSFIRDLLLLVAHALRPLSIREVWDALGGQGAAVSSRSIEKPGFSTQTTERTLRHPPPGNIASFFRRVSRGLLEVGGFASESASKTASVGDTNYGSNQEAQKVTFVHWTARAWVQDKLSSLEDCTSGYHAEIARRCIDYLRRIGPMYSAWKTKDHFVANLPFSQYVTSFLPAHLHKSGESWASALERNNNSAPIVSDLQGMSQAVLDRWIEMYSIISGDTNRFKSGRTIVLHVAAHFDISAKSDEDVRSVNIRDAQGRTPLSHASQQGHVVFCERLVRNGADFGLRDYVHGQTPLGWASAYGHADVAKLLLKAGANVNDLHGGSAPLALASLGGYYDVVKILLRYGADPNAVDLHTGLSPLAMAAGAGHARIVSLLLKQGAQLTKSIDANGWGPLQHAVSNNRVWTAQLLLQEGPYHTEIYSAAKTAPSWISRVVDGMVRTNHVSRKDGCDYSQKSNTGASSPNALSSCSGNPQTPASSQTKGRKRSSDDNDDDLQNNGNHNKKPRAESGKDEPHLHLACPYYKRDPRRHCNKCCAGRFGWPDVHRVKEHLYKVHERFRCPRCNSLFRTDEDLNSHSKKSQQCLASDGVGNFEEGFDSKQRDKLKSRKHRREATKATANGTLTKIEEQLEYWRDVYRILFPDWEALGDIPWPCCEQETIEEFQKFSQGQRRQTGFIARLTSIVNPNLVQPLLELFDQNDRDNLEQFRRNERAALLPQAPAPSPNRPGDSAESSLASNPTASLRVPVVSYPSRSSNQWRVQQRRRNLEGAWAPMHTLTPGIPGDLGTGTSQGAHSSEYGIDDVRTDPGFPDDLFTTGNEAFSGQWAGISSLSDNGISYYGQNIAPLQFPQTLNFLDDNMSASTNNYNSMYTYAGGDISPLPFHSTGPAERQTANLNSINNVDRAFHNMQPGHGGGRGGRGGSSDAGGQVWDHQG